MSTMPPATSSIQWDAMSPVPRRRASVKRCGGGKHLPSIGHLEYFWPGRFVLLFEKS